MFASLSRVKETETWGYRLETSADHQSEGGDPTKDCYVFATRQGPKSKPPASKQEADLNDLIMKSLLEGGLGRKKEAVPSTPEASPENSPPRSPRNPSNQGEKTDD